MSRHAVTLGGTIFVSLEFPNEVPVVMSHALVKLKVAKRQVFGCCAEDVLDDTEPVAWVAHISTLQHVVHELQVVLERFQSGRDVNAHATHEHKERFTEQPVRRWLNRALSYINAIIYTNT
jgi:hypothetical protein